MILDIIIGWISWQDFFGWFNSLRLIEQIIFTSLIVAFAVSVTVIVCIGLYYLIKYLCLGIFYILKGIFKGFKFVINKIVDLIDKILNSGGHKVPLTDKITENRENFQKSVVELPRMIVKSLKNEQDLEYCYCTECGMKFTDKMNEHLDSNGMTFCIHCGQCFRIDMLNKLDVQPINQSITESYT
ncbi:MAG: hypothetical protein KAX33_02930 [Candidatus Lokiarchaeota archaeon]|nr:hypothetical protein [Candidatus Lokiarchaeota archaeon]